MPQAWPIASPVFYARRQGGQRQKASKRHLQAVPGELENQ